MHAPVFQRDGTSAGTVDLADAIFNIEPNDHAIYQAVVGQRAHDRQGTHATKNRAQVRGGGRKPFRQKGTGRARQGSIRASLYVGGGRAHGPTPHPYAYQLSQKLRTLARKSALTYKARENAVMVVEDFALAAPKTKELAAVLDALHLADQHVLFVTAEKSDDFLRATRNLRNVDLPMRT